MTRIISSTGNRLCGVIRELRHGEVSSEAMIELEGGKTVAAIITEQTAVAREFQPGRPVCALVKASHLNLGVDWLCYLHFETGVTL